MNNIPKELQELRANVETLTKKYQEIKAMPPEGSDHNDKMRDMEDMIFRIAGYIHDRISYLENDFYDYQWNHSKGHFPPVKGAAKMTECLKTLGLDKDYEVYKPMIAAASDKYGFEVDKVTKK